MHWCHFRGFTVNFFSLQLSYISPFNVSSNDPDSQAMIHGLIGTPATRRSIAPIVFPTGPYPPYCGAPLQCAHTTNVRPGAKLCRIFPGNLIE